MTEPAAFIEAIRNDDLETLKQLLESVDPNDISDDHGHSALALAARFGRGEMVRVLLAAGARVDAPSLKGRTALHNAVWQADLEAVRSLLDAGADVNAADSSNWTPIFLADDWDKFELLIERGARVDLQSTDGESLIRRIAESKARSAPDEGVRMIEKLEELGLNVADEKLDRHGATLLMEVVERGARKGNSIAQLLIDRGIDPLHATPVGVTALHYACKSANLEMVHALLALGADPNAEVTEEWYAFEKGARPIDMVESYMSEYPAIKRALADAGQSDRVAAISNAVEGNRIVVDFDMMNPGAALNVLLQITSDIKTNVYQHPDYDNADGRLAYRFDIVGYEDAYDETVFFELCAEHPSLRPDIEQYVRQIIAFNNERGLDPVYTHDELEAGGAAIASLLDTEDSAYLSLFLDYVKSIDLDHTVHLHELMDSVRDTFEEKDLEPLTQYFEEMGFEA